MYEVIRAEVEKLSNKLSENQIVMKEIKTTPYSIIYKVLYNEQDSVKLTIFCNSKREFTIKLDKAIKESVFYTVKTIFENRNKNTKHFTQDHLQDLKNIYSKLEKYANENFDFLILATELAKRATSEDEKAEIIANQYNFEKLKVYYDKVMGEVTNG